MGKGEIARNEQFLLFPKLFSTRVKNFLPFSSNLKLSSANSFSLEESKFCRVGKGSIKDRTASFIQFDQACFILQYLHYKLH